MRNIEGAEDRVPTDRERRDFKPDRGFGLDLPASHTVTPIALAACLFLTTSYRCVLEICLRDAGRLMISDTGGVP